MDNQRLTDEEITQIQIRRKETAIRLLLLLIMIVISIIGLIVMTVNHVPFEDRTAFRSSLMFVVVPLTWVYVYPLGKGLFKTMNQHPYLRKMNPLRADVEVPSEYVTMRWLGAAVAAVLLILSFNRNYNPQPEPKEYVPLPAISPFGQNNLPDVEESSE